jgi:hypothetical protein
MAQCQKSSGFRVLLEVTGLVDDRFDIGRINRAVKPPNAYFRDCLQRC